MFFNGIAGAQKKLGSKVAEYAMHIGGEELPMHDSRLNPGAATSYHLDATPGRHTQGGSWMLEAGFALPGLDKHYAPIEDKYAASGKGGAAKAASCFMHSLNSAGLCMFGALMFAENSFSEFLTATFGTDYSMERILETGWRIASLRMAFNLREGVTPTKLSVPKRILGLPPLAEGPLMNVRVDNVTQDREFLDAMGWDTKTAASKTETIEKLGLSAIVG